jgi:hypothetical protein
LLAGLQSFAFDYVVRQKTAQPSLPIGVIEESAFPAPPQLDETLRKIGESRSWILDRVVELSYTAWDLQSWAESLGYAGPPFLWDEDRRSLLRAELDALFFHVFGLSREDSEHILNTFPIVREDELNRFGEYRTSRLAMDRFDAMAEAIEGGRSYESILTPPPVDPTLRHAAQAAGRPT